MVKKRKGFLVRFVSLAVALAIVMALIGGCGAPAATTTTAPPTTPEGEAAAQAGATGPEGAVAAAGADFDADIVIATASDLVTFDPWGTTDPFTAYIIFNLYTRLFVQDKYIKGVPELAKSYEMVSDTEWRFTIWDDVKAHDGSYITIDDVVWSLNQALDSVVMRALFAPVLEINRYDDRTVQFITDGIFPSLPSALSNQGTSIVPQSYGEWAQANDDWTQPVGTGRYKLDSRVIGDSVRFVRFDDYFNPEERAKNASITYLVIPEGTARTIAVETGRADINIEFMTADYDRVMANPDLKLHTYPSQSVWHLGMDHTHEWFSNRYVRQAVSFAIDREACLYVGHDGKGVVMYNSSTFAPSILGAIVNPLDMYRYDPEEARRLMALAGSPQFQTDLLVMRDEAERIATVIQANLAEIGITVNVNRVEQATFLNYVQSHQAPMFITTWGCYWDPDLFLSRRFTELGFGGANRGWYSSPELDEMIRRGRSVLDLDRRIEYYRELQEFMAYEAVQVDLLVPYSFALARADLLGVFLGTDRATEFWMLHY